METLHHCTKRENLDKILKDGLIPNTPQNVPHQRSGVYLSEYKFDWMYWVTDKCNVAGAVIEVNISGLKIVEDYADVNGTIYGKAYVCLEKIPVERFVKILVSTNEKTTVFDEIVFKDQSI